MSQFMSYVSVYVDIVALYDSTVRLYLEELR